MVQWVVGSVLQGEPTELYLVPGCGMCYPICATVHIKVAQEVVAVGFLSNCVVLNHVSNAI